MDLSEHAIKIFIILFISGGCYVNTLNGIFVFDDTEAVLKNGDLNLNNFFSDVFLHDFWGTNITSISSHKSYRPLTVLFYRFNIYLSGSKNPLWFHSISIILYMSVCATLYLLLSNLLVDKSIVFNTVLLFTVHPVHTEVVASIVGQADLLCALLYLLALLLYNRAILSQSFAYYFIALFLSAASIFCKEIGITVLCICGCYDTFIITRHSKLNKYYFLRLGGLIMTTIVLLYLRWRIMNFTQPIFQPVDNPASFAENIFTRIMTYNYIYLLNVLLLLWPQWLCFDWSMGCISLIETLSDIRIIIVLLFWIFTFILIYTQLIKKAQLILCAIVFSLISFSPASNLLLRVGFVIAERTLFLPSIGFCMFVSCGFNRLCQTSIKYKILYNYLFFGLCVVFTLRTLQRSNDWLKEHQLFVSGLGVCPENAKVHYNIAKVAADKNDIALAEYEYRKAIELHPTYDQAMNNLANLLRDLGKLDEAKHFLTQAVTLRPEFAAAWMNLGIVLATLNQDNEAEECYWKALKHRRNYADCYYNLGNLYLKQNRSSEALQAWQKAVALNPSHSAAWSNILVLLDGLGQYEKALQMGKIALNSCPTTAAIYFTLGSTLGKLKRWFEAEKHFQKATEFNPNNALYYSNFGVLYHRWGKTDKAIRLYERALQINPKLSSALNNLNKIKHI